MDEITSLNELEEHTQDGLTILDIYADWCGPCKLLGPVLELVKKKYEGQISFIKANADKTNDICEKYNVKSIPTVILFKDGLVIDSFIGFLPQEKIESFIDKNLTELRRSSEKNIYVDTDLCIGCASCVNVCPQQCMFINDNTKAECDHMDCVKCCACVDICPTSAVNLK